MDIEQVPGMIKGHRTSARYGQSANRTEKKNGTLYFLFWLH